jgi:hypothetical protein
MKNLSLLPTEKPSRLFKFANQLHLDTIPKDYYKKYNSYITSDEEIKEGDWGLSKLNEIILFGRSYNEKFYKKIILTTDQDLIANGVQAIDDKFLEWFVKNPTVEYVTVERLEDGKYVDYLVDGSAVEGVYENYKIIIPQEESKCTCEEHDPYCCEVHGICPTCVKKEEPKTETVEEVAKNYVKQITIAEFGKPHNAPHRVKTFIEGAKWQSERMYSEEEVIKLIIKFNQQIQEVEDVREWFEQFKKK